MSEDVQTIAGLLAAAGVPSDVARAPDQAKPGDLEPGGDLEAESALAAELEAVAAEAPPEEVGGMRVVVADRFVNIGEASWKLLTSVAALAISSLDPTGLTRLVALKQVLEFVKELRPLLRTLDPAKAIVCAAVATITAELRRGGGTHGASRTDLTRYFADRGQDAPAELDALLTTLERDGVLATTFHPHSGKHYAIRC